MDKSNDADEKILDNLKNKLLEVTEIPPQQLGLLTPIYKALTKHLKVSPWPAYIISAVVLVIIFFAVFGPLGVFLVSVLQRGI